jgi:hypothetical protein
MVNLSLLHESVCSSGLKNNFLCLTLLSFNKKVKYYRYTPVEFGCIFDKVINGNRVTSAKTRGPIILSQFNKT